MMVSIFPTLLLASVCSALVLPSAPKPQQLRSTAPTMIALPRRQVGLALLSAASASPISSACAADGGDKKPVVWISGKSDPLRPTSKEKPDGTKKDNKYLGCLNDCAPRKQGGANSGTAQMDRLDALEACQQECCFTYEQCTYTIRK